MARKTQSNNVGYCSNGKLNFVRIFSVFFAVLVFFGTFFWLKLGWFMGGVSSRNDMQAPQIVAAQARHTASLGWIMGGVSSRNDMQAPQIVAAQARHTASLIFLHGLGDTGHSWAEFLRELKLKNIRCICPTAPTIPVTLNGQMRMPSWFDIMGLSPDAEEDDNGIKKASDMLKHLVEEEEKLGIPSNRIMLGGFSQGGAVALYTGFTINKTLAGVVALSSWMPLYKTLPQNVSPQVSNMPVFQGHGTGDRIVNFNWGQKTHELITQFSKKCVFVPFEGMDHSTCPREMKEVRSFLESTLPAEK